jgi:ATP-dependent RNA helicase DeaD
MLENQAEELNPVSIPAIVVDQDPPSPPKPAHVIVARKKSGQPVTADPNVQTIDAITSFSDLPLSEDVQRAIQLTGYEQPTSIQAEIIPLMLDGRDVMAQAQTGTGKTAAFALPILSRININRRQPQVLVLTPTRELAIQVAKSFSTYGSCLPRFSVAAIYGGQDYEPQLKQLRRGVDVIVGTPGRIIDHIKRGTLDLSGIECLVLDEADEMLNMGFLEDVEFVLEHAPKKRQIALFSATIPQPIREIAQRYLDNPAKVTIRKKTMTAELIRQRAVFVNPRDKMNLLIRFLEAETTDGVIVFTRTRDTTTVVAERLIRAGLSAAALNGEMQQRTRERTIERLKSGQLNIVVATDVAARGLDVTRISHVFNFDFPEGSESYIHRIGRTGRAGRKGEAVIFLSKSQRGKLRLIEKATRQPIEIVDPPSAEQVNQARIQEFKQQLADTIAKQDLGVFRKLIGEFAEQSGEPLETIASAIAYMGQQGRSFLVKELPACQPHDGNDRRGSKERKDRKDRGGKRERYSGPPEPGMNRYRVAVGRRDGVGPGNIVGAVANEAGIDGQQIGPIQIHDSYSTIDLPEDISREVFESLRQTRIAGRPLDLRPARESDHRSSRPRSGKHAANQRPRGNKSFFKGKAGFAGNRKKRKVKSA